MNSPFRFDWGELAFGDRKPIKQLKAIFIAAPREISEKRFKQLVKEYLPQGNIVLGLAKEQFIEGFEDQPQFRTLKDSAVRKIIDQVNAASKTKKIYTLEYFQRELPFVLEKISFKHVVLINGSWRLVFHSSPSFFILTASRTPYDMVSPFTDEQEARQYEERMDEEILARLDNMNLLKDDRYSEDDLLHIATHCASRSYDYGFQTGLALGRRIKGTEGEYKFLIHSYNQVVPYQTYAMLHGSAREKHFSPPNDLNYYDTVHAEVKLLIEAQKGRKNPEADLHGTTLFINLMPCPPCARMLSQTDIEEFVYSIDHSDGYAVKMLEAAGKKVRRIVP